MGDNRYLALVISFVMFIIGLEYLFSRSKGRRLFRFQNTISNLLMGTFDRIAGLFMVPLIYFYYEFLYEQFRFMSIPETTGFFLLAVLCSDFIWYFYHKYGHRINIFWGAHVVHHQSEDYNYSVALNLTPFQVIFRVLFWSLMPVFGFTPAVVLGTHLVIGLYQFLLHTTLVPKLGFIERIFVTPSHHRVHHGSNEVYLDKNYGGILIIWDRIFGTFQEENETVVYGLTKDVNSRDFLTMVFHYYQNLRFQMKQLPNLKEKLLLLVKGPDWVPPSGPVESLPLYVDKGHSSYVPYSRYQKLYIVLNIVFLFVVLSVISYFFTEFSGLISFSIVLWIFLTLVLVGKLLEKKNTRLLEAVRILLIFYWCYGYFFTATTGV